MVRTCRGWLAVGLLMGVVIPAAVAEDVQVTTYYPAPRGMYDEVRAKIFIDWDNINFFLDPASTSKLQKVDALDRLTVTGPTGTTLPGFYLMDRQSTPKERAAMRMDYAPGPLGMSGVGVSYPSGNAAITMVAGPTGANAGLGICADAGGSPTGCLPAPGPVFYADQAGNVTIKGELTAKSSTGDAHIRNGSVVTTASGGTTWRSALWNSSTGAGMGVYYPSGNAMGGFVSGGGGAGLLAVCTDNNQFCNRGALIGAYATFAVNMPSGNVVLKSPWGTNDPPDFTFLRNGTNAAPGTTVQKGKIWTEGSSPTVGRMFLQGGAAAVPGVTIDENANVTLGGWGPTPGQRLYVNGDAYVTGTLSAGSKLFVIPHPLDPAHKELVHASLEGPEHGVYYRGSGQLVDGKATVELPAYVDALTQDGTMTVQLTARGATPFLLSYERVNEQSFVVHGSVPEGQFDWEVQAVRADQPPLQVERTREAGTQSTGEGR